MPRKIRYQEKENEFSGHPAQWYVYSDEQIAQFKKMYAGGVMLKDIGIAMNKTPKQVRYLRMRLKLKLRRKSPWLGSWTEGQIEEFKAEYKKGKTLKAIAFGMNKSFSACQRMRKKLNIDSRVKTKNTRRDVRAYLRDYEYEGLVEISVQTRVAISQLIRKAVQSLIIEHARMLEKTREKRTYVKRLQQPVQPGQCEEL